LPDNIKVGGLYLCLGRGLYAYIYRCCIVYIVFIGGREYAKGIILINSNVPNIYVRDIVAVFKLFARAHPPVKKISHYHYVAAQAQRSRTHVSAFALVVY
jgi:hypothetical protein